MSTKTRLERLERTMRAPEIHRQVFAQTEAVVAAWRAQYGREPTAGDVHRLVEFTWGTHATQNTPSGD